MALLPASATKIPPLTGRRARLDETDLAVDVQSDGSRLPDYTMANTPGPSGGKASPATASARIRHDNPMDIISKSTHRVLAYIGALNGQGVHPRREIVDAYAANPERTHRAGRSMQQIVETMFVLQPVPTETFCHYLARLSWINDDVQHVELTPIGRALLQALNAPAIEDMTTNVFEVVLDPDNPFAYAQAFSGLSSAHDALLVEPYLRFEQFMDVARFENIVRALVGSNLRANDYELLASGLASLPPDRPFEIRKTTASHDRYLIPAGDGPVLMLGSSLSGIGKKVSTITTLGDVTSRALRATYETIWRDAEPIEPAKRSIESVTDAGAPTEHESDE